MLYGSTPFDDEALLRKCSCVPAAAGCQQGCVANTGATPTSPAFDFYNGTNPTSAYANSNTVS